MFVGLQLKLHSSHRPGHQQVLPTCSELNHTMPEERTLGCLKDQAMVMTDGGEAPAETQLEREDTPSQPAGPDEDSLLELLFQEDEDLEGDSD